MIISLRSWKIVNDKLLNFLGLCRRAGKLNIGSDLVLEDIYKNQSKLIIMAQDISKNTEKKILLNCHKKSIKSVKLNRSKDELSYSLGKFCVVVSVVDQGFATKLIELINQENQEENI